MSKSNLPQFPSGSVVNYHGYRAFVVSGNTPDPAWSPDGTPFISIRFLDAPPSGWSERQDVYAEACTEVEVMKAKVMGWDSASNAIIRFVRGCGCEYRRDGCLAQACTSCVMMALNGSAWRHP